MRSDLLRELLNQASEDGPEAEPAELLAAVAADASPLAALQEWGGANRFFSALEKDVPWLVRVRGDEPLQDGERDRWVLVLRWLITQLRQWEPGSDPRSDRLVAILVIAQAHDWRGVLWQGVPAGIFQNVNLVARPAGFVRSFEMTFGAPESLAVPIWEREAVERLLAAERERDWAEIGDAWQPFQNLVRPSTLQIQAVRFLSQADVTVLARAVYEVKQVAVAMLVASVLNTRERLQLALAAENPFVDFACAYVTLHGQRMRPASLLDEAALFTQVLERVAKDAGQWRGWMAVFNRYPVRFPALHACLGDALASAPPIALDVYVDVIQMFPHRIDQFDPGRKNVAACLSAFRAKASLEQRKMLWRRAHQRWLEWAFDADSGNSHLLGITRCELDFAVVGFAIECLDEAERMQMLTACAAKLATVEDEWHRSESDLKNAWFTALSQFQLYAHATRVTSDDWLPQAQVYYPPELAGSAYFDLRYPPG